MANIYDMVDTWNDAGTTFTSIKMNATDTASNAASLLMDLQVGGVSQFKVTKGGKVSLGSGAAALNFANNSVVTVGGVHNSLNVRATGLTFGANGGFSWTAVDNNPGTTLELSILRDAANTLAQRNSTNAQAFNLYNTFTDASNYERGFLKWNGNVLEIGTEAAGTGTARALEFQTDGVTRLTIGAAGNFNFNPPSGQSIFLTLNRIFHYAAGSNEGVSFGNYSGGHGFIAGASAAFSFSPTTAFAGNPDAAFVRADANTIRISNGSTGGGAMQMTEMTAPAAPAANNVRIYAEDDGAGKTRLMALFATGAAQQIAIEP